jgi:dihydroxyacetone kinase phosphoprotein-dependent L subunit
LLKKINIGDSNMNSMNCEQVRQMLLATADRIIRNEPYLTRIDSAIGDGDHGLGMKNGMIAAKKYLEMQKGESNVYSLYTGMADAMQKAMGGASGMIFSTLFAGNAAEKEPSSKITPAELASQIREGLEAIKKLGHAEVGDKTMVDALEPAVMAMQENTGSFEEMFRAGEATAKAGMEKTKEYIARFGRAKSLGERSIGHQDAGATSTWLIFAGMLDFVAGTNTPDYEQPEPGDKDVKSEYRESGIKWKKKIINNPSDVVKEEVEGFLAAFSKDFKAVPGVNGLVKKYIPGGKTALVIGGGSGHEPMFGFFLGENLADASANGNVFTSPDPETIAKTAEAADRGAGVLFLYGNYTGDNLNFDKAAENLEKKGIRTKTIRVWDDIASAPRERITDRRGIAGDVLMVKIAGAACATLSLDEAYRVSAKARDNLYSIGVGLEGATIPGQKDPIFTLPPDEIEYGLGIHGEPGIRRIKMPTADEIAETLLGAILADSGIKAGDKVCTYVNGLGSTTLMELMILNRKLRELLEEKGIIIHDMDVNSLVTTMEMAGASFSIMKMDDELIKYYDMPCNSPYYKKP